MISWMTFEALGYGDRFLRRKETESTGGSCLYRKIPPRFAGVECNAARCWSNRSEFVPIPDEEEIILVVE